MDLRAAQGREIAQFGQITKSGDAWLVPSRSRVGLKFHVTIRKNKESCTCPDFATNGGRCKHIHAVLYRTEYPQAQLIDPPSAPVEKKQSKTYPQDWPNYNLAQTQEKDLFMQLLAGLCETIEHEEQNRPGRPRIPLADTAFLACYKVFEGTSARRFMSDARAAMRAGHTSCAPHFNSVLNALNDPRMTEVLLKFITITSLPFTGYENTFAADSSGFTSSKYDR